MVPWEYARFFHWIVEHLGDSGQGLVDKSFTSLAAEYTAGQYPSPPVIRIWELPASSSGDSHRGSSSSADKIFEDNESDDVADRGGLMQGGSQAPPVYVQVAAVTAGVTARADEVVAGCLLDEFDMEPLF